MRIVSLLPSATEIICSLGLRDKLVGVTHECDFPLGVETLLKVTRTLIPHDATSGEIDALVRQQIIDVDPEMMVIACCGFNVERTRLDLPILESYPGWSSLRCVQNDQVHIVDGSAYFSRPGPRLVDSLEILADLIARYESSIVSS